MKVRVLITGIAGSGKSTICKQLSSMGYESYGIEDIDGMFEMYRKDTKEIYHDYDNSDPKKIKNADWLCNIDKLKKLLEEQTDNLAFYCGVASNMDDILPLFNKMLLLKIESEALHLRLSNREGTEDIGNTEASRQTVLGWKDWWEKEMVKKGAIVVDASDEPLEIVQKIILLSS